MLRFVFRFFLAVVFSFSLQNINAQNTVILTPTPSYICTGGSLQLNCVPGALSYTWSPATGLTNANIPNPIATPTATPQQYCVDAIFEGSNLVTNGDFELGNVGFNSDYFFTTGPDAGFPSGVYTVASTVSTWHSDFIFCNDHTPNPGSMAMMANGADIANQIVWQQTITVVPGTKYAFSAWLSTLISDKALPSLQFSINGVVLGTPFSTNNTTCEWLQFFQLWTAPAGVFSANISVVNQSIEPDGNDFALDDISFSPFTTKHECITINTIPNSSITTNVIQPTCAAPTGSISVTAPIGITYQYRINGGAFQNSPNFTGLTPNNYTVTVRSTLNNSCTNSTAPITINAVPTAPTVATTTVTQPTCAIPTGSITVTNPSGANFEYSINGGAFQAGTTFNALAPNSYTITVRRTTDNTCTSVTAPVTINAAPTAPAVATTTVTQPTCATTTGTITVTSPTGANLEYSINGGAFQSGTTFTALAPNSYTITVRRNIDNTCTSVTAPITINAVPTAPAIATTTVTQPTCATPTGTITVTNPLGANLEYSINGGAFQSGTTFSALTPNSYTIIVRRTTDNTCTSVTAPIIINAAPNAPVVATTTVTQPTCTTPTGTITVTNPLSANFEYSINGGAFQGGTTFSALAPNNYTITARRTTDNTCTSTTSPIIINAAPTAPAVATTTVIQPTCATPTGKITVTNPLGANLEYSINGGAFQTGTTFNALTPNNYIITVRRTNDNTCTSVTSSIIINGAPTAPAIATTTVTQPTCAITTGTIAVTNPLGASFEYSINGGAFQAGTTFNSLTPNSYTITVRSTTDNTCTSVTAPITINAVPTAPAVATTTVTQPTCATLTGTITVTSPTGANLEYNINGGAFQTGTTFNSLTPNSYTLTVRRTTDNTCTSITAPITINAAPTAPAIATSTVTQPTCATPTGTIAVTNPLGANFEYSINGGAFQAGTTFNALTPNSYTITVRRTNDNTCTSTTSSIIINDVPTAPAIATTTVTQPTCATPTGTITVTSPTGVNFEYRINGGAFQTGTTFSALAPNSYTITVRSTTDNTCTSTTSSLIINAVPIAPVVATTTVMQPTCATPTGTIKVTNPLGASFEYSINGGAFQTGATFNALTPNNYTINVRRTNDNTCTSTTSSIIINAVPNAPAVATTTVTQPTCATPTGTITVNNPLGANFEYSINGGAFQTGTIFNSLTPNSYTITVRRTNDNICTSVTAPITITVNQSPTATAPSSVANCVNENTKAIKLAGNATQYQISVDKPIGLNNQTVTNTIPSFKAINNSKIPITATVSITPFINNCPGNVASFTITVNPLPQISITKSNDIDCRYGSAQLTATGGLSYTWLPAVSLNQTNIANPIASPATNTTYHVTGRDVNRCENTASISVKYSLENKGGYLMPNAFAPSGFNKCYRIIQWGVVQTVDFSIYNRWGELVFFTKNPNDCWDGTYKGVAQPVGGFVYIIHAKTNCEGIVERKGNFVLLR